MIPSFCNNDLIICLRHFYKLKEGDVILINIPELGVVIKRIKSINKEKLHIEGDNKAYISDTYKSEYYIDQVLAKVIFKLWKS
tara:strand:- start:1449 stop:1697 length:249 start_codon:yes stop_codon:yes gene_type:complete